MSEFEIKILSQARGDESVPERRLRDDTIPSETRGAGAANLSAVEVVKSENSLRMNAAEIGQASVSVERLQELVTKLRELMPSREVKLKFSMDDVLNRPIISVHDKETGELVKQLPSAEVLRAVHNIDSLRGILFDDRT